MFALRENREGVEASEKRKLDGKQEEIREGEVVIFKPEGLLEENKGGGRVSRGVFPKCNKKNLG